MGSGGGRRGPSGMTRTYDGYCGYHSASILYMCDMFDGSGVLFSLLIEGGSS